MEGTSFTWLDKISNGLEWVLKYLLMAIVAIMALVLLLGVASRYVLPNPIVGTDEIALFAFLWVTVLGASLGIKSNDMVAVTLFIERFEKVQKPLQFIVQLLVLFFNVMFLVYGYKWVFSPSLLAASSPALQIPLWIIYIIFPISMLATTIFSIRNIVIIFKQKSVEA